MSDTTQPDSPQNDTPASVPEQPGELNLEWSYSGKAMWAQALLFGLISLLLLGGGIYSMFTELPHLPVWCSIAAILVILWGYYYTIYFYRVWTIRYRLTDQRLYVYRGLFVRTSDSMELVYVDDIRLVQTLFDRILNGGVGSLHILCASDKTDSNLLLKGIDKPQEIFEKIDVTRATLRAKRSILTGT